jgi:chaperonin GroES
MKIRPLQDRVVVKRQDEETTSAGGIVLPGSATENPQQGIVVAVGPGKKSEDGKVSTVVLKVGDHGISTILSKNHMITNF